ncbi:MAG: erythromycin esterase family protein [Gemmatimonadaceae bacterium]
MRDSLPGGGTRVFDIPLAAGEHGVLTVIGTTTNFNLRVVDDRDAVLHEAWIFHTERQRALPFFAEDRPLRVKVRSLATEFPEFAAEFPPGSFELRLDTLSRDSAQAEARRLRAAVAWAAAALRPLAAVQAGAGFDDLRHLHDVLRDVRIVGLGEATHGTREFFQAKHRLIEFLVSELGFTVVAFEMDAGAAEVLDEYIRGGPGELREVVASQGMWQFNSEEVVDLVAWLRDWNARLPEERRVRLVGFDFQVAERGRLELLRYLERVAPERVARTDSLLRQLVRQPRAEGPPAVAYYTLGDARRDSVAAAVNELLGYLVLNEGIFVRATSAAAYGGALAAARCFAQFTHTHARATYATDRIDSGVATRSRYMAENVLRLLDESAGARVIAWAHNGHVRADPYTMGFFLRERLGGAYYAVGLGFDRGGFRALELTASRPPAMKDTFVDPAYQQSMGWLLRRAGGGNGFLDLRAAPRAGPAAEWLAQPRDMRSVGNGYIVWNPSGYLAIAIAPLQSFDGILFIEQTTPAVANTVSHLR